MKKQLRTLAMLTMCVCTVLALTGCSSSEPYSKYDLTEYITLPDYNTFTTTVPDVEISDDDVATEITSRLEKAATTESITEGTVAEGDTVKVSYEGALADGTVVDGMSSDSYTLELGSGSMIDGFEEGLYGATIGKQVTLQLTFPDPYETNTDLSGKDATFVVTVLSKEVSVVPELTDAFAQENGSETVAEYKEAVKKELEQTQYESELQTIKTTLYNQIVEETEVIKYPEKELKAQVESLNESYEEMAEDAGVTWEEYLSDNLSVTQDEFDETVEEYAKTLCKQEMVIYALSRQENITVTDEEYDEYLDGLLAASDFEDDAAFKEYTGMTVKEYADKYKFREDYLLSKELDTIYERVVNNPAESTDDTATTDDTETTEDTEATE
jgi:trigger factor